MSFFTPSALGYRTAADDPAFRGTAKVRWDQRDIDCRIHTGVPSGIQLDEVAAAADAAFGRWTEASNGQIRVRLEEMTDEPAAPADGVNTIQFIESGWETRGFDPTAAGITDVSYVQNSVGNWIIAEADLYLNAELHTFRRLSEVDSNSRDLDSVLTHEAGHMLGLWHPCEIGGLNGAPDCDTDPNFALVSMYPVYAPTQISLTADDIAGVDFLYGVPSCEEQGCAAGFICSSDGCRQECGGALCGVNEFCTADGCWPTDECYGRNCESNCRGNRDCGDHQVCVANTCIGRNSVGDPCQESIECATRICAEEGVCLSSCLDCQGGTCQARENGTLSCSSAKLALGAECKAPEQCGGGECLVGAQTTNVCTRQCTLDADPCPKGWRCSNVDDTQVCTPIINVKARGGGGCALPPVPGTLALGPCIIISLMVLSTRRRARRVLQSRRQR